jgi:alginate O-acetyltransferase complex protein AlgI
MTTGCRLLINLGTAKADAIQRPAAITSMRTTPNTERIVEHEIAITIRCRENRDSLSTIILYPCRHLSRSAHDEDEDRGESNSRQTIAHAAPGVSRVLFNSFVFLCAFLPVTYLTFWCLRTAPARYIWLTLTGYVFYGYWDPRFTLLMAFSTIVSYLAGLGFLRWSDPPRRRLCLVIPITLDLCLLGFFKYTQFVLSTMRDAAGLFHQDLMIPQLAIVLPIGISFYTFHTISYIVDAYRGDIRPTRNFFEFSAYVSLFSQLVAGPIVRFRQIEKDLDALGQSDRSRWLVKGLSFFVVGLVEKVIIADSLAAFVDPALLQAHDLSSMAVWLVFIGYSLQLYFDFVGYSDMAVGLGYLFGLRIPQNFNSPYKALDPSDFWRRWHISLSMCLRDYVYIPLGGNRDGEGRTYRNLLLTMLIGGLWHGANWTFIVWGAYHGLLLALYRRFSTRWDVLPAAARQIAMFVLVLIGWVFFRAPDLSTAADLLTRMFVPTAGTLFPGVQVFLIVAVFAAAWAMVGPNAFDLHADDAPRYARSRALAVAAMLGACLAVMSGGGSSPFLYFQF